LGVLPAKAPGEGSIQTFEARWSAARIANHTTYFVGSKRDAAPSFADHFRIDAREASKRLGGTLQADGAKTVEE
jgi:hypothetical protein